MNHSTTRRCQIPARELLLGRYQALVRNNVSPSRTEKSLLLEYSSCDRTTLPNQDVLRHRYLVNRGSFLSGRWHTICGSTRTISCYPIQCRALSQRNACCVGVGGVKGDPLLPIQSRPQTTPNATRGATRSRRLSTHCSLSAASDACLTTNTYLGE